MHLISLLLLASCAGVPGDTNDTDDTTDTAEPVQVRFATFNTSLFRNQEGALIFELGSPSRPQPSGVAAILQEVRPDVVLLNEVDWDADGEAIRLLQENFLGRSQDGRDPLTYAYVLVPETNTGVASGEDLDNNGQAVTTPGTEAYGNDALGFGVFPGQYGLAVLSRYPIDVDGVRTFRKLLWNDFPGALLPADYYSEAARGVLPLSSKTHADVPITINGRTIHFLVSHPTPPAFDGPEDRNGKRNHDEIRFWTEYLDAGPSSWQVDDQGRQGGLNGAAFVIAGDLNADPFDGDSTGSAIAALLAHPRVNTTLTPSSPGGTEQASLQGGVNASHQGDPAHDTADFNDTTVGNLRLDYVLPSTDLTMVAAGVFWPLASDPLFPLVGTFPFPVSDHRLVWVDVRVDPGAR